MPLKAVTYVKTYDALKFVRNLHLRIWKDRLNFSRLWKSSRLEKMETGIKNRRRKNIFEQIALSLQQQRFSNIFEFTPRYHLVGRFLIVKSSSISAEGGGGGSGGGKRSGTRLQEARRLDSTRCASELSSTNAHELGCNAREVKLSSSSSRSSSSPSSIPSRRSRGKGVAVMRTA